MTAHAQPVKTLGNLNGPWLILLKVMMFTLPFIVAHAAWVTSSVYFNAGRIEKNSATMMTQKDANDKVSALSQVRVEVAQIPSEQIIKNMERLEKRIDSLVSHLSRESVRP